MDGLDGDQLYYADFNRKKEVYTLPKFGDPIECTECYELAVCEQTICKANLLAVRKAMKDLPAQLDPPRDPQLYPRDHPRPSMPNTLVCQASGFYPAPVVFSWTRNRANISSFSVSQAYPQSDGSFTQFSTLEVLPKDGEVYSCSLEHPALKGQRRTRLWRVQFQRPSLAPTVFSIVGLSVGLLGVAVGTFCMVK